MRLSKDRINKQRFMTVGYGLIRPEKKGFTLVETIIGSIILVFLLIGCFQLFRTFTGKKFSNISARLTLQMEARRALVNIYMQAQEGIEILKPDPGSTLPFLVLRDLVNDIHFFFLQKDKIASEKEKSDMFRLYSVVYDIQKNTCSTPHEILANVKKINFTAHGFGEIYISGTLREGEASFSLINMIRLRNACAEDVN